MHPLKQYLRDIEESLQDFAERVGASRQTLYRIIGGGQVPKPPLARRIVEATGGVVSLETLYNGSGQDSAEVVGLHRPGHAPLLEMERIRLAVAVTVNHLMPQTVEPPPAEAIAIAAEAVVNTYAALATVTTRQGPDRLGQALRPVLEEILREYGGQAPPSALDRGADLAAQIYYQSTSLAIRS